MKISKQKLLESDLETLYTCDPDAFFEAILINILWNGDSSVIDHDTLARQKLVFHRWFRFYESSLKAEYDAAISSKNTYFYDCGFKNGQIKALNTLPFKKSVTRGKIVDLVAVAARLKELKAIEPKGVE